MAQSFVPGDYLLFQLESAYGLLRVLAVSQEGSDFVWHLLVYEEFFPDLEAAEQAVSEPKSLHIRQAHMALTSTSRAVVFREL